MKKHIIVATVFVAIGMPAWAHPEMAYGLRLPASTTDDKKSAENEAKPTTAPSTNAATTSSSSGSTNSSSNDRKTIVKEDFVANDGQKGELIITEVPGSGAKNSDNQTIAIFTPEGCTGDIGCKKQVLVSEKVTAPFAVLEAEIRKSLLAGRSESQETRRQSATRSGQDSDISIADFKEEFQDDLYSVLETACGIEPKDIRTSTSRDSLRSQALIGNQQLMTALAGTQWANMELPNRNEKASCAASVISDFMSEKEDEFNEEAFEIDETSQREIREKVQETRQEIKDLKRELRRANTQTEKNRIQSALNAREKEFQELRAEEAAIKKEVDNRRRKVGAANDVMKRFVDTYFIRSATLDVASGNGVGLNYLHELASATPDSFKSVRESAANALLNVYRTQAQSQLALRDAANRTTDPNLKLQFQNASNQFGQAGLNYNATMMNPATHQQLYDRAFNQYLNAHALAPWSPSFDEVQAAQNYARNVTQTTLNNYSTGAQQITNYLGTNGTGTGTLPQALHPNNTSWVPNTGISPGRASSRQPVQQGGQNGIIRGQRPTVRAP